MYLMHRGGGIPPELPDSQVTSLFVRFSLIVTLLNLFLSLGTEIHVTVSQMLIKVADIVGNLLN